MKFHYLIIILLIALLDQLSKSYVRDLMHGRTEIFHLINIIHAWNSGISFGMFQNMLYSNIILAIVSLVVVFILGRYLFRTKDVHISFGLSYVIGGAAGNIVDRIRFSRVFDFIDLHIGRWHWPTFNVADMMILLGVSIILYRWYVVSKKSNSR